MGKKEKTLRKERRRRGENTGNSFIHFLSLRTKQKS
jgi:hypothetical protein